MAQAVSSVSPTTAVQARSNQAAARASLQVEAKRADDSRAQRGKPESASTVVLVSAEGSARSRAEAPPQREPVSDRLNSAASGTSAPDRPVNAEARPPQGPPPGDAIRPGPGRVAPQGPPPATDPAKTVSTKPLNAADADSDGAVSEQEERIYNQPQTAQKDPMRAGSMLTTRQGEEATRAYMTISQQPVVH